MIGGRALRPDELGDIDVRDLADAMAAGRQLEGALDDVPLRPSPDFADRVMSVLAEEPSPAPAGFLIPIRRRGLLGGFAASVRQAWVSLGAGRPALARSAALAYVLVVAIAGASLTGVAAIGAAGALGILGPDATQSPEPTPEPSPAPTVAPPTVAPSPSPDVTPAPVAPTPSPSETPDESDDNGGNSGPGGGGDDGGSGNSGPGGGDDDSSRSGSDSG
jgi:uncharacterized membrane protein YgcG